jgi:DNA-binding Lrp family transcriptional regulator
MTEKLDMKDKKLLYYLSRGSKTSDTQLAKHLGMSKNAVKYREDRMKKEGIIKNFTTLINLGSLKLDTFTILLKFNEDIYENENIINYFKNHDSADWVITLSGEWDILAEFVFKDFYQVTEIIKDIINNFNQILNSYQVFFSFDAIKVEHLVPDFYKDFMKEALPLKKRTEKKYDIDDIDKQILCSLSEDSSISYVTLAQKLKITTDIVRYRIKKMQENDIIVKFFPDIPLQKLGYTKYLYLIKLKNLTKTRIEEIKRFIQINNYVTYAFFDTVSFNLIFSCAFRSSDDIDRLSRNLRKQFSDVIEKQDYLIEKDEILFNLFPRGLVKR